MSPMRMMRVMPLLSVGIERLAYASDRFAARAGIVDTLKPALQTRGKLGVVILPVAADPLLRIRPAGRQAPRGRSWQQGMGFANLGRPVERQGDLPRHHSADAQIRQVAAAGMTCRRRGSIFSPHDTQRP